MGLKQKLNENFEETKLLHFHLPFKEKEIEKETKLK